MQIYLIRHGQTDYNLNDLIQGWTDNDLNENGIRQAIETANKIKDIKFDIIYTSDLKRALRTAQIVKEHLNYDIDIILDRGLREQHMGDWEGQKTSIIIEKYKDLFIQIKNDPFKYNPPNGEKFQEVVSRIKYFLENLGNRNYRNVLIVGHQIVNAIIYVLLNNIDWKSFWNYKQKNGEIWIVKWMN